MTGPRIIVAGDAPREVWMAERGEGVTASQALAIARATLAARRKIAEQKMNGSTFRGNAATRAGHAREAALLDEAAERLASCEPNAALWGAASNDLHRATPDGIGVDADGLRVVVEVKSHEFGWENPGIPAEHMAQLQWQIHVLDAAYALYGFEVRDEDDMPPADGATWIPVERDPAMIAWLVERADAFIAWREAGCPTHDDLPDEVKRANAAWVPAKRALDAAADAEKAAAANLRKAIAAEYPHAARFGAVGMGYTGGFQLVPSSSTSIDDAAWTEGDPNDRDEVQALRVELAYREAAALAKYPKVTARTPSLRFQEEIDV